MSQQRKISRSFERRRQKALRLERIMREFLDAERDESLPGMRLAGRELAKWPREELNAAYERELAARAKAS